MHDLSIGQWLTLSPISVDPLDILAVYNVIVVFRFYCRTGLQMPTNCLQLQIISNTTNWLVRRSWTVSLTMPTIITHVRQLLCLLS